jgi:hypothetical protein
VLLVPEQRLEEVGVPVDEAHVHLLVGGQVPHAVQKNTGAVRVDVEVGRRGEALQRPDGGIVVALLAVRIRLIELQL